MGSGEDIARKQRTEQRSPAPVHARVVTPTWMRDATANPGLQPIRVVDLSI